jgi:predicted DNA-binding transcriptional regulator AlpA
MVKRIVRPKEAIARLGIGRSNFYENIIGSGRLRLLRLGPRSVGVLEHELDALIDELIRERDAAPTPPRCAACDGAEGLVMKKKKTVCDRCGETFFSISAPGEAEAEYRQRIAEGVFAADADEKTVVICDDCYAKLRGGSDQ